LKVADDGEYKLIFQGFLKSDVEEREATRVPADWQLALGLGFIDKERFQRKLEAVVKNISLNAGITSDNSLRM